MDPLTFLAQLVSAVAWPLTALVMTLLLRRPLMSLLPILRKLKWHDLEAEFGAELGRARDLMEGPTGALDEPPTLASTAFPEKNRDLLLTLARLSPRSVILEAWREVEAAASRALRRAGIAVRRGPITPAATQALTDAGLLDDAGLQLFAILRHLRNRAAHEEQFGLSQDDAIEFAIMAQHLANRLAERAK